MWAYRKGGRAGGKLGYQRRKVLKISTIMSIAIWTQAQPVTFLGLVLTEGLEEKTQRSGAILTMSAPSLSSLQSAELHLLRHMSPRRGFLEGRGFVWSILMAHSIPKTEVCFTVKSTFHLPMWERSDVMVSSSNTHLHPLLTPHCRMYHDLFLPDPWRCFSCLESTAQILSGLRHPPVDLLCHLPHHLMTSSSSWDVLVLYHDFLSLTCLRVWSGSLRSHKLFYQLLFPWDCM